MVATWQWLLGRIFAIEDFFSLEILVKTWAAPWKDDVQTARNIALDDQMKLWEANFVSRIIGFTIRTFVIIFSVVAIGLVGVLGVVGAIAWILMPLFIIGLPLVGLTTLL